MATTTRRGLVTPEGSAANDVPSDMRYLANQLDHMPTDAQGPLESRATIGNTNDGQYYYATTNGGLPWNVLYRWDGAVWHQLNPTSWQDLAPVAVQIDSGPIATITMNSSSYCRYRLTGTTCQFKFQALVHTAGPSGYTYGIATPVMPKYFGEQGTAIVQNIAGLSQSQRIGSTGAISLIKASLNLHTLDGSTNGEVVDGNGNDTVHGNMHLGTFDTYDRFNIEYEI